MKEDPSHLVDHFDNNCAYIGWMNAIICDAEFVRETLQDITSFKEFYNIRIVNAEKRRVLSPEELDLETKETLDNLMRGSFLTWFLGHEIGHAVLHQDYVIRSGQSVHFDDPEYDERELEADLYVAKTLTKPSQLTGGFWLTIGEFIEHEYRKTYEELKPFGKTQEVNPESDYFPIRYTLEVEYSEYRLPLLLRAIRVIDVLTQQSLVVQKSSESLVYVESHDETRMTK